MKNTKFAFCKFSKYPILKSIRVKFSRYKQKSMNVSVSFDTLILLGKKDGTYNSVNDPEILEIRDDNSIGKRGAYEADYFSRGNENFPFIQ